MNRLKGLLIWTALLAVLIVPIALAARSPLLAWRDPVYIGAGFAGIVAMCLLLVQPLLTTSILPGLSGQIGRRVHRWSGLVLILMVILHVAALWITSPPDVVDALLFVAPTPFSYFGVIAMWVLFSAALLAGIHRKLKLHPAKWRFTHTILALIAVVGSVIHAVLIEGSMETNSKILLCILALAASINAAVSLRTRRQQQTKRTKAK